MSDDEQVARDRADALAAVLPPVDNGNGNDVAAATARQAQAVSYRLAGLTYEQIAQQMGYTDRGSARRTVLRALAAVRDESVGDLRAVENLRLERAHSELWQMVVGPRPGDERVDRAMWVDFDTRLRAIDSMRRLSERRSKLNGMDAPTKIELSPGVSQELQDAIDELREAYLTDDGVPVVTDLDTADD